ncbi:HAMP domain-containing sensor histidine kinase [Clostridium saccharobutylicum]|uniref:histidine kinase n=1 Tax=Clostridium saccharobutylicum DSM 13864 TaxID=1345695 RepID=U5MUJ1_CLOSA|nr:HAMP domain-containing sensor histidine kinase [Clostridium saccharobutylicum]AGX44203.1 sensor histidine kinase ResE [Clostridium saccharobutylicum DSM 13864]AQR91490.1 sensor histidine kinase YycG [Clostridium saccharobutylicum]AQS01395.1 sensor histidine kinase YycG [Clostridium saccharobutylicum]AQS15378.1 sensor histidine kinase YycG [Clostridium saccharobutylicum]MBA2906148.1 signal transduction histidine kinase [Clostridium saccharobutylicum]
MKTIKTKLFFIFTIFMVALVACGIFLNSIFLESYYIYKNKNTLALINKKISSEYINDKENSYENIDMVESIDNVNTVITDNDMNIEYNSGRQKRTDNNDKHLSKEIKQYILDNESKLSKKEIYYIEDKNKAQTNKLVFISKMSNGGYVILRKPIKNIHDSVVIANEFYMFSALIVILIGGIFILIFSKRVTKPIVEMSNVAENICNLEFDRRVEINSKDEIGKLGESINKISEKLCVSINELKNDVERRKQLVRDMSHELKTPLGIIKGYAEGLKYGVVDDKEKVDKYCSVLVEECDRMDKLVRELLEHSAMESGNVEMNITCFEIREFISKVVQRFDSIFTEKKITFDLLCINDCLVKADRNMIEKAVNNFITNAINHIGGRKLIQLIVEEKENKVEISVFNTGNHIPDKDIGRVWDVYYKVDKSRTREYGGHGIGLSIVKLIAELHNGATKVKNVDEGVIFSIEVPKNFT